MAMSSDKAQEIIRAEKLHVYGPFGDKAVNGSMLVYGIGDGDKEKQPTLTHEKWGFSYWIPKDAAEAASLAKARPDVIRDLMAFAAHSKARSDSWHECKGGATTVDIEFAGKVYKGVNKEFLDSVIIPTGKPYKVIPRLARASKGEKPKSK